jgi:hypothetical protein
LSVIGTRIWASPCQAQALSLSSRKLIAFGAVEMRVVSHARPAPTPTEKPTPPLPPKSSSALAIAVLTLVSPFAAP